MSRAAAFIEHLQDLKAKKAWVPARAALRRSLAFDPGSYPPAIPYVESFVREDGWRRQALYLVAALYALKDGDHQEGRTLATALREKASKSASIEKRFLALLDADRDQIVFRLRHAVALVQGGLDFSRLLEDLWWWFDSERRTQARWAREFYSPAHDETQGEVEQ